MPHSLAAVPSIPFPHLGPSLAICARSRWSFADRSIGALDLCTLCFPPQAICKSKSHHCQRVTFDNALGPDATRRDVAWLAPLLRINWQPKIERGCQQASPVQSAPIVVRPVPFSVSVSVSVSCVAIPSNCLRHTSLACCHMLSARTEREREKETKIKVDRWRRRSYVILLLLCYSPFSIAVPHSLDWQ